MRWGRIADSAENRGVWLGVLAAVGRAGSDGMAVILGINALHAGASAALLVDGKKGKSDWL